MNDLPEVRQILRDNGLADIRSKRLNRKGLLPRQLRHFQKVEDSSEDTDEEGVEQLEQKELALSIVGQKAEIHEEPLEDIQEIQADDLIENFLAGK